VDIPSRCAALKERVTHELQEALDTREKEAILVAALYELARTVIPELGRPIKSLEYQEKQDAVLGLVSFITLPLIRNSTHDIRWVAVLTEIAEGCLDPLLQKKLSVYAQQLLVKTRGSHAAPKNRAGRVPVLLGLGAAALLALFLAWPEPLLFTRKGAPPAVNLTNPGIPPAYQTAAPLAEPAGIERLVVGAGPGPALTAAAPELAPQAAVDKGTGISEQTTKVKITNNQVLVPVLLKNGGETVKVVLMLDTGATRTSIHEGLAGRLRIDLRTAKMAQSEVADGRMIRTRSATIDSLGVGPFTMASAEVNLIPFEGAEGLRDGLLGMDFLAKHRYQIDMEQELIRWF
jgi:hypothetical protein